MAAFLLAIALILVPASSVICHPAPSDTRPSKTFVPEGAWLVCWDSDCNNVKLRRSQWVVFYEDGRAWVHVNYFTEQRNEHRWGRDRDGNLWVTEQTCSKFTYTDFKMESPGVWKCTAWGMRCTLYYFGEAK